MSDKLKRKQHYRRWWAFRGLLIALIVFFSAIGYLLTRQPKADYIIYQLPYSYTAVDSGALMRANLNTGTSDYLIAEISMNNSTRREVAQFVVSGDGKMVIYTDFELDFGIRAYAFNIQTTQRKFLFDCVQWAGNCFLDSINYNGSKLTLRVMNSNTTWYEFDAESGGMLALATSTHSCISSGHLYQELLVAYICDPTIRGYQLLNYKTGNITTLPNISSLLFADDATHYAYTVSLGDADFDQYGNPLPRDVFVGQWGNETSKHLLAGHVGDVLEDWHPDNKRLLVSRYTVEYDTDGGYEFVLYDSETGEANSLLYLRGVYLSQAQWDADGTKFVYVMSPMYVLQPELSTSVWVYDLASGETSLVGQGGGFPQWAN